MAMLLAQQGSGFPFFGNSTFLYTAKTFQAFMLQLTKYQIMKQEPLLSK